MPYDDEKTALMAVACNCRIACCQVLESAVLAFKLDKCWKEAGFRPLLDGQKVDPSLMLCSFEQHRLLGITTLCNRDYALR